jgi:hypothetical protein
MSDAGSIRGGRIMLFTLAVVLLILWLLGFLAFPVGGSLIHVLLILAVISVVLHLLSGRRRTA